jgi:hypothetical protein
MVSRPALPRRRVQGGGRGRRPDEAFIDGHAAPRAELIEAFPVEMESVRAAAAVCSLLEPNTGLPRFGHCVGATSVPPISRRICPIRSHWLTDAAFTSSLARAQLGVSAREGRRIGRGMNCLDYSVGTSTVTPPFFRSGMRQRDRRSPISGRPSLTNWRDGHCNPERVPAW